VRLEEACSTLGLHLDGRQVGLLLRYRDLLVAWNRKVDLVAPAPPDELLRAHVLDSLLLLVMSDPPAGALVADVGTGAGLPGLVWAVARPDLRLVLVEPRRKRAAFVERAASELGIPNAEVVAERAEELCRDPRWAGRFDMVVARAVGPPQHVLQAAGGLLKRGGRLVVPVGPSRPVPEGFHEVVREVPWETGKIRRVAIGLVA
jgi:16S rRNA (guanine527-N7)-methyltransferase